MFPLLSIWVTVLVLDELGTSRMKRKVLAELNEDDEVVICPEPRRLAEIKITPHGRVNQKDLD